MGRKEGHRKGGRKKEFIHAQGTGTVAGACGLTGGRRGEGAAELVAGAGPPWLPPSCSSRPPATDANITCCPSRASLGSLRVKGAQAMEGAKPGSRMSTGNGAGADREAETGMAEREGTRAEASRGWPAGLRGAHLGAGSAGHDVFHERWKEGR